MKTIHKFELPVVDRPSVLMPSGAVVLAVGGQDQSGETVQVWALVDTEREAEERRFAIVGTGNPFPPDLKPSAHSGTVIARGGSLVWHVFEEGR